MGVLEHHQIITTNIIRSVITWAFNLYLNNLFTINTDKHI